MTRRPVQTAASSVEEVRGRVNSGEGMGKQANPNKCESSAPETPPRVVSVSQRVPEVAFLCMTLHD